MARGTEATAFAGKRDEHVVPAVIAMDTSETLAQIAALEELPHRGANGWTQITA